MEGIQSVIGRHTPIIGGSSADEEIAGLWREFSTEGVLTEHVVASVWFPSAPHGTAFQSGYAPTGDTGVVTRADGRRFKTQPCTCARFKKQKGRGLADKFGFLGRLFDFAGEKKHLLDLLSSQAFQV